MAACGIEQAAGQLINVPPEILLKNSFSKRLEK